MWRLLSRHIGKEHMKNFEKLIAECESDLKSIGVKPGFVASWHINTRAKSRWGQCQRIALGIYSINISERLLQDDVSDQAAKNTIMHELIHTVTGCHGHTGRWQQIANKVNRLLPQYTIKRTTSNAEKGIEEEKREPVYKYAVTCTHCGTTYYRKKASKLIQNPDQYKCGNCGFTLKRIDIEKNQGG